MIEPVVIGDAILYNADCLDILPTLGKVDAVVTDPPYGVDISSVNKGGEGGKRAIRRNELGCYNDSPDNLRMLINNVLPLTIKLSNCVAICTGIKTLMYYPQPEWIKAWVYENKNLFCPYGFNNWTPILCYGKDPFQQKRKGNAPLAVKTDVIYDNIPPEQNGHPTPKPVSFMTKIISRISTDESDTILDPFMGSGTTGVAALKLGRKFIGIEIDKTYFDIACNRIRKEADQLKLFTGDK